MSYEIRTTGDKEKTMKLFFDVSIAENTSNYYNVFFVIMFSLPFYALHWYLLLFLQKMESHFMSYTVNYTDLDENCRSEDIKIVFFKLKEW